LGLRCVAQQQLIAPTPRSQSRSAEGILISKVNDREICSENTSRSSQLLALVAALALILLTTFSTVAVFSAVGLLAETNSGGVGPTTRVPKLLFGIGPEADSARQTELARSSPVRMLTSWYTGPKDLSWMSTWKTREIPQDYTAGYALHLIVWSGDAEGRLSTPQGPTCGRAYPLSSRFLGDMRKLAIVFAGRSAGPPLYVTLFAEFQTYPCRDNAWAADAATVNYYRALKAQYLSALATFHRLAPNSRVSLGWGGWQARWDAPGIGGGRSMFPHFADVMKASDFQSFQAMDGKSNVTDALRMTRVLGRYGPVMLAYYKPNDGSQDTFNSDVTRMLTDTGLREAVRRGLFAFSFMDDKLLVADPGMSKFVSTAIARYGAGP